MSLPLPRRSPAHAVTIGFFVLIIGLVSAGLWMIVQQQPRPTTDIPDQIAGYRLVRSVKGAEALQAVGGMHRGTTEMTDAWIAYYDRGAISWVGITRSPSDAQEQLDAMLQAIGRGGTPFSKPQAATLGGYQVFTTGDQGSVNYFFRSGLRVVWVRPPNDRGSEFLNAALPLL